MTPERWRRIDDLFDDALRVSPAERDAWLREACDDDDLRAEVGRLLAQDDRADREGFLTPPEVPIRLPDQTENWSPSDEPRPRSEREPSERIGAISVDDTDGFLPKAAIATGSRPHPISEPRPIVRARLRELPMIYILILGM
jgi:eukaryotic-like serine/threonine-protein kinase